MSRLQGKVAIITGGSRGIGKATALLFGREGAEVIILDVDEKTGNSTLKEILETGAKAAFYRVDVSKLSSVQEVSERILKNFRKVDILINNAGITADRTLKKMSEEDFDRVIAVNLKGVYNCTKVFSSSMLDHGSGVILNASSVVAHYGNFGQTNYVATKAAVIGMTRTWAKELGPKGIRVNAVAPGFVITDMVKSVPEDILSALEKKVPLRRLASPDEIANVYLFLASDESSYINGAVINVDGGLVI